MNTPELKAQMARKEMTAEQLCAAIGISKSAWYRKTNGITEFTQGEIYGIRATLGLDDHLTTLIFFNDEVS